MNELPYHAAVTPAERIDMIKRVRPAFDAMPIPDAELHFDEFGVVYERWRYFDGSQDEWMVSCLRNCTDDQLTGLSQYLLGETPLPIDDSAWRPGEFRVFVSHLASEKLFVSELSNELQRWGMHAFVAHEHIEPGTEWESVIISSLATCDCLVALLHPGFHESNWTDQEVGYVLGRGKLTFAVRAGVDPYGFMGRLQGIPMPVHTSTTAYQLAQAIVRLLCSHTETGPGARQALVDKLTKSTSWDQSNRLATMLKGSPRITKEQYMQLQQARVVNYEISDAHTAAPWLDELEAVYGPVKPAVPTVPLYGDEDPF